MTPPFVHLHNHTEYSLLDGAARLTDEKGNPSEFIRAMAAAKFPALAVTDHGNLFGAIEFYSVCTEVGIKPIIGIEAYIAPESRLDRKGSPSEASNHLTILATSDVGYKNLMKLTSRAYLEGYYYKPRIDREILAQHAEGLVGLSGCLKGEVSSALLRDDTARAEKALDGYRQIFGKDNFYVELMDHGLPDQRKVFPRLVELAQRFDAPLVATNDCHYFRKEDAFAHDVLLCIGTGKTLDDPKRLKYAAPEFYYKSTEEMLKVFGEVPQALANTLAIAERSQLNLKFNQILLPRYDVPVGESPESYLEKLCLEGLKKRFGHIRPDYKTRLDYELGIIRKMGFATYFLIVWDFIHYARSQGVPVGPGRGSGAGALTAFALSITNIDPLQNGLLFERFLNPERRSMPDLDIDFSDDGREKVIDYVRHKYGETCVAQIITFGSMLARLVVRDVGRVLDLPLPEVDKVCRLIPRELGTTIHTALQAVPELQQLYKTDPRIKKLLDLAQKLEGLKRHTGVHAAGTIIAAGELTEHVPLAKGSRDVITTQYNDEGLLKLGLLKVDFLGLRTLSVIRDAVNLVRERHVAEFDIDKIPLDDPATFKLLAAGADGRGVSTRIRRHAGPSAQAEADHPFRRGGAHFPLPARPHGLGHVGRVRRAQARPVQGQVRPPPARTAAQGHLRHHRLPGTGDADRPGPRRLHAGAGGPPPQSHGQKDPRDPPAAEGHVSKRVQREGRRPEGNRREGVRPGGPIRRVRV
jgi:DNA polymerase-3 subunit alpha